MALVTTERKFVSSALDAASSDNTPVGDLAY